MPNTAAEVRVAVGVLRGPGDRVLLALRHADSHQGGLWEFPGGKVEAGESLGEALQRELAEELGVRVREHRPLLTIRHDYGDKCVCLEVEEVLHFDGEPVAREGQPLRWVRCADLADYRFPAANAAIVSRLQEAAAD